MNLITKQQIIKIKTLMRKLGADSADMALDYSNGRTEHVSHLTVMEAIQLIKWLLNAAGQSHEDPADVMRKKIISMAHEMHWELPFARKGKSNHIDMDRVNSWCIRYSYLQKPLDMYEYEELPKLVTQFQKVLKDFLKGM